MEKRFAAAGVGPRMLRSAFLIGEFWGGETRVPTAGPARTCGWRGQEGELDRMRSGDQPR
jgi:hypothetical protein